MARFSITVLLWLAVLQTAVADPTLRIVRDQTGKAVAFEAEGLDAEKLSKLDEESLGNLLAVYVLEKGADKPGAELPPLLGEHKVDEDSLRFTPRFSLLASNRYRAVLRPDVLSGKREDAKNAITLDIAIAPLKRKDATVVTQIYPSSDRLPENQLRFYLHFSQPMSKGEAYTHLKLLKENGQPVELPFLELGEELWDGSGKRLTLLIDPGRIKRGLKPREDVGPVLEAGQSYTLQVAPSWKDATGEPLKTGHSKKFFVDKPVEVGLDTAAWKVAAPAPNSKQPLVVKFPGPLDHALLQHTLVVLDGSGKALSGDISISNKEKQWQFTPREPWASGGYTLEVDKVLEDPAGNRIGRAFELAAGETAKQTGPPTVRIPFEVTAPKVSP
jgi:hypothetical protein